MEPILYCACYDHLCSNNPANYVVLSQDLLRGLAHRVVLPQDLLRVVSLHDLLRGIVLRGLVRRLQGLSFRSLSLHSWFVPRAMTLYS